MVDVEVNKLNIWIILDKDGFIDGWSSTKIEGGISIRYNQNIVDRWQLYKFIDNEIFYDESRVLSYEKEETLSSVKDLIDKREYNKGIEIKIENEVYTYRYTQSNKSYLDKIYNIVERGLIDDALFNFEKDGVELSLKLDKTNINELWILSYLYDEKYESTYADIVLKINESKSLDELNKLRASIESGDV